MYKILNMNSIQNLENGTTFPVDEANRHYQAYKKWISEGNIPSIDENFPYEVVTTPALPARWVKEGEEDLLEQPMVPERWSDGITTVWAEEDIPPEEDDEGNMIPDTDFVYFPETEDDTWIYIAASSAKWEVVAKEVDPAVKALEDAKVLLASAISFGSELIIQFGAENMVLGITQDNMTKTVRENMSGILSAISTGSLKDAILEIKELPESAKDPKYLTDERLLVYLNKIENFLGLELSESL